MARVLFSKKYIQTSAAGKSQVFKKIMENKKIAHIIDTPIEKKKFYKALQDAALKNPNSGGITKNTLRHAMGTLYGKGKEKKYFSNSELLTIGKELVGGSASSRVIQDEIPAEKTIQESQKVDKGKVYQEIMDKRKTISSNDQPANVQKNTEPKSKTSSPSVGSNNLHNVEHFLIESGNEQKVQSKPSSMMEYIVSHQSNEKDKETTKEMIARIQGEPSKEKETDSSEQQV